MESPDRPPAEPVRGAVGPHARPEAGLVRVDVADPGDHHLVQQQRLQGRPADVQAPVEIAGREAGVERLGTQPRQFAGLDQLGLGAEQQPSEAARVAVAQLPPVVQLHDRVQVVGQ